MPNNVTYRVLGAANGLLQLLQGAQQRQEWEKQQRQAAIDAMAPIQGALGQLRGLQSQNYPMAAISPEIQNLLSNPNAPIAPADRARILGELTSVVSGAQANQTINTKGQEMMGSLQAMQAMGIPIPEVDVSSMSPAGILGYGQAVLQQAPAMQKAAAQTAEDAAAKAEAEAKRKQSALTNLEMQVSRLASNPNLDPQARDMIEQLQAKRDQWGMQPVEELERLGASMAGYEIPKTPAALVKQRADLAPLIGKALGVKDLTAEESSELLGYAQGLANGTLDEAGIAMATTGASRILTQHGLDASGKPLPLTPEAKQELAYNGMRYALGGIVSYILETEPGKHPGAESLLGPDSNPTEMAEFINRWAAIVAGRTWKDRLPIATVTAGANPKVEIDWSALEKASMNDARKAYLIASLSQGLQRIGIAAGNLGVARGRLELSEKEFSEMQGEHRYWRTHPRPSAPRSSGSATPVNSGLVDPNSLLGF